MRDAIVLIMVLGSLPIIFSRPWIGILVWSWLGYMNPHRLTWGFAYSFPFAALVGLVTLASLVFYKGERNIKIMPLTIIWFTFIFWMNLSTITALDFPMSSVEWDRTMKIQLFALLTVVLIRTKEQINLLVIVVALSLGFFGVKGGIYAALTGGGGTVFGPPGTFIEDNNALGLCLVMTLPLLGYMYTLASKKLMRLAILGSIGLTMLAILSTQSRGAFLALAATGGVMWLFSPRKILIGMLMVIAAAVLYQFMPDSWHDRMASIGEYQEDGSAMGRINAWWFAFNFALDHPLTGGGFGTFTPELFLRYAPEPDDFHDSHSIYFEVLAEHGFAGLFLFLSLGAAAIFTNIRTLGMLKRHGGNDTAWLHTLARMLIASLCAYAAGGAFLGLAYFDLYYHLIALTVILRMYVTSPLLESDPSVTSSQLEELEPVQRAHGRATVARPMGASRR